MKCYACSYEYEEEWLNGVVYTNKGKESFKPTGIEIPWGNIEALIYVCPKCGTLRVDI